MVSLWYFWVVGMISMFHNVFLLHLCNVVIFDDFECLTVEFSCYLLVRAMDGKMDYASTFETLILGW